MCSFCGNLTVNQRQYDPTRTTTLRNLFSRQMRSRFAEISRAIRIVIIDRDVFGLNVSNNPLAVQQVNVPGYQAFDFPLNSDKLQAFKQWLESQIDRGMLEVNEITRFGNFSRDPWTNKYITDSYKRGVIRARYELKKAGFDVPTIEQSGGINATMGGPVHVNKLSLLYQRVFSDLKGITDQMDSQISRVLAQGLAEGENPRLLARKLLAVVQDAGGGELGITDTLGRYIPAKRRAEILARTEVIRAHHTATMNEYEAWGAEGFKLKAELVTAGDNRVCPECIALEGGIYTIEQARTMIPVHPMCRCIMLPYKVE